MILGAGPDTFIVWIGGTGVGVSSMKWILADRQGSVAVVTDNAGKATQRFAYDPFGNEVAGAPGTGFPFRYTGQRFDPETGLYYYKARYYSAKLGRFLQTDPIGYKDDFNLYAYVKNDPLNATDPSGLCEASRIGTEKGSACGGSSKDCAHTCQEEVGKLKHGLRTVLKGGELGDGYTDDQKRLINDAKDRIEMSRALGTMSNLGSEGAAAAVALFVFLTKDRGAWGYKSQSRRYNDTIAGNVLDAFGNIAFGAMAMAFMSGNVLSLVTPREVKREAILRLSGAYHSLKHGYDPARGIPALTGCYGDDCRDRRYLNEGMDLYEETR